MKVQSRFDNKKIGELVCDGAMKFVDNFAVEINGERVAEYKSLDAVAKDWKDVEEPLIKDEKVRKAVRAWAEANDIEDGITYLGDGEFRSYLNTTIDFAILVDEHRFDLLKKGEDYTVTELCREEE